MKDRDESGASARDSNQHPHTETMNDAVSLGDTNELFKWEEGQSFRFLLRRNVHKASCDAFVLSGSFRLAVFGA